jgi:hypothetical protein
MHESEAEDQKGSLENPFFFMTSADEALRILYDKVLAIDENQVLYFEWQGSIYTMDLHGRIEHRFGSNNSTEMLREKMKKISDR